jgi:hypothetical protein
MRQAISKFSMFIVDHRGRAIGEAGEHAQVFPHLQADCAQFRVAVQVIA